MGRRQAATPTDTATGSVSHTAKVMEVGKHSRHSSTKTNTTHTHAQRHQNEVFDIAHSRALTRSATYNTFPSGEGATDRGNANLALVPVPSALPKRCCAACPATVVTIPAPRHAT